VRVRPHGGGIRLQTFTSLRHRNYRYLWIGTCFNSAGQWIEQITKSWLIYEMTDSAAMLGAVNGVRAIPFLLVGPVAGVIADRVDRRKLMLAAQSMNISVALMMAILLATDLLQVWHLFAFTLLAGCAWSFNQPVRQALVPNLVPKEELMNAIALNSLAFNVTRILGPTLGGFFILWFGAAGNFFIQSGAYVGVFTMVALMNVPHTPPASNQTSVRANLVEGLRYVRSNETALTLVLMGLIPAVLVMPMMSLLPVFAKDVLDVGPDGFGVLIAFSGVGAVCAALTLATAGNVSFKGSLMLGAALSMGLALIFFSRSTFFPLSLAFLVMLGASQMSYMMTNNTVLQTSISDEFRGRVFSIYMLDHGFAPLGSLTAGIMADVLGAPTAVTIMGAAVTGLAIIAATRFPHIRRFA
jgi:MFS family permease